MTFLEDFQASERRPKGPEELTIMRNYSFLSDPLASYCFLISYVESLPVILRRTYRTMRELDSSLQALLCQNEQRCEQEILDLKQELESGSIASDRSLTTFSSEAVDEQNHCIRIADEKVAMATRAYDVVDAQIQQLDQYLQKFEEIRQVEKEGTAAGASASNNDGVTRSGRGSESNKRGRKKSRLAQVTTETPNVSVELPIDPNEPTYCFCNQVSYGEMVACDNPDCKIEWFHFGCVGLKEQPKGKWYCSNCAGLQKRRKSK